MTDFTVCNRLLVSSASLELTQICSFLWPSNIPLYICTTTSLSIYLSMDIWVASVLSVVTSASVSIGVHEMNIFLFFLISYCKDNILCIFAPFFFLPHLIVSPGNTILLYGVFFQQLHILLHYVDILQFDQLLSSAWTSKQFFAVTINILMHNLVLLGVYIQVNFQKWNSCVQR